MTTIEILYWLASLFFSACVLIGIGVLLLSSSMRRELDAEDAIRRAEADLADRAHLPTFSSPWSSEQ